MFNSNCYTQLRIYPGRLPCFTEIQPHKNTLREHNLKMGDKSINTKHKYSNLKDFDFPLSTVHRKTHAQAFSLSCLAFFLLLLLINFAPQRYMFHCVLRWLFWLDLDVSSSSSRIHFSVYNIKTHTHYIGVEIVSLTYSRLSFSSVAEKNLPSVVVLLLEKGLWWYARETREDALQTSQNPRH